MRQHKRPYRYALNKRERPRDAKIFYEITENKKCANEHLPQTMAAVLSLTLACTLLIAPAEGQAAKKKMELNKTKATLYVGKKLTLKVKNTKKKGKTVITAKIGKKKLTADLRSQTTFDFVVGGSYGPANKEYLAWYLDDVELIY